MLRSIVPSLHRVAIMANVGYPAAEKELGQCQAAAQTLDLDTIVLELRQSADIERVFDLLNGKADALYVVTEALTNTKHIRISTLALAAGLPTIFGTGVLMNSGGLMAYGPSLVDLFRRAADYVDKILRGANPVDLPVEQPTKFDLIINMTTAKALGLTVPPTLLALADKVIE